MLVSLHIDNIALIKKIDLDLPAGFLAITGETGSGKSTVVDSLGLVCGLRLPKETVRLGENSATVEAVFGNFSRQEEEKLQKAGISPDEDGYLFIQRTLFSDGKSVAKINSKQVSASVLKEISPSLINDYGQHDNTELLNEEKHIEILDNFADNRKLLSEYELLYENYCGIKEKIKKQNMDSKEKQRKIDILKLQISDIKNAKLKSGEEEELEKTRNKLRNIEKIKKSVSLVYSLLYNARSGMSVADAIEKSAASLRNITDAVSDAAELAERLDNIKYEVIDIAETVNDFTGDVSEDPTKALDRIETRLDLIAKLKSKYGSTISEIVEYCRECEMELENIELSEENIAKLEKELSNSEKELSACAEKLSERRKTYAKTLSERVLSELQYLDMKGADFTVDIQRLPQYSKNGIDDIKFIIKMNSGESYCSLAKTASGGELSRLMLSIKSVLAEKDGVGCLVFDEIDTGMSGKTSRRIGSKLKSLSLSRQVVCVTHSAQIASLADVHYKIYKKTENDRTQSYIEELSYDNRVKEVARIIAGINISDSAMNAARELMLNTDNKCL